MDGKKKKKKRRMKLKKMKDTNREEEVKRPHCERAAYLAEKVEQGL